jgi:hypothetical protein
MSDSIVDWGNLHKPVDQLTPAERLRLIEELAHSLRTEEAGVDSVRQRTTLERLRQELAAMPVYNPGNGFSNRDHDTVLYGDPP